LLLGVSVQGKIGEHHPEAERQLLGRGLPLLVGEQGRVEQRERRARAQLSIGHPSAVTMVVEAEPHRMWRLRT
jgi:hypothetical protein